jgi:hypothetical protein
MFTSVNPKLVKGEVLGFLSFGLHLAPARISGYQTCASASVGCRTACLYTSGHGQFTSTQTARIAKTLRFFEDREKFLSDIVKSVRAGIRKAMRESKTPTFRLNLTSDVRWEYIPVVVDGIEYENIMSAFPTVQFYDYTKHRNRRDIPANYHLTFSRSEDNDDIVPDMLARGFNVAVVFDVPLGHALPDTYMGVKVIDGRDHDLRFLDESGVIVGLSALGRGKKGDHNGFVVKVA